VCVEVRDAMKMWEEKEEQSGAGGPADIQTSPGRITAISPAGPDMISATPPAQGLDVASRGNDRPARCWDEVIAAV
jgi:hypothetical protein